VIIHEPCGTIAAFPATNIASAPMLLVFWYEADRPLPGRPASQSIVSASLGSS
jgi:hypothetical protein